MPIRPVAEAASEALQPAVAMVPAFDTGGLWVSSFSLLIL